MENNKVLIAGYGTFISDGLRNLTPDMTTTVWGRPVKVVGATKIDGWRRVTPPNQRWAVVIPDDVKKWWQFWKPEPEKHFFHTLVIEVPLGLFPSIDHIEGYPYYYDRIQVDTEFGKVWMYIPAKGSSLQMAVERAQRDNIEMEDTWAEEIAWVENEFARAKYPQFFGGDK